MRPDHGGRIELKLCAGTDASARYLVTIFTPEREVSTEVAVDAATGGLTLGEWQSGTPPSWLEGLAKTLLRTALRSKQSDGEWPRRVTRWRPEPKV